MGRRRALREKAASFFGSADPTRWAGFSWGKTTKVEDPGWDCRGRAELRSKKSRPATSY